MVVYKVVMVRSREETKAYKKQYDKDHREEIKQYRKDHRERKSLYDKQYRKDNADKKKNIMMKTR